MAVANQAPHTNTIKQCERAIGYLVGVAPLKLARPDTGGDFVGEPRMKPGVQLLGERPQLLVSDGPQPQFDPQHPVVAKG